MKTVSVSAHFDGEHIRLDELLALEPNTKLIVTVLPAQDPKSESWALLARGNLENAYGDDEEGYPLEALKVPNPGTFPA
jgi:hypothetical protein